MMGERNSMSSTTIWWKRISVLGLSLSTALIMLFAFVVSGAMSAGAAQNGDQPPGLEPEQAALACPADMISYWKLDETSGTVFSDTIGELDASCSGNSCPAFVTGRVDGALSFDGVNDGLTAPDDPLYDWNGSDSFSIELWVNTAACDETVFLGKHEFPTAGSSSWWLGCNSTGNRPAFSLRDSTTASEERITANTSIADGNWHHLVGVHDAAADEMRLYVDGTVMVTKTHVFAGDFNNENPITFGFHSTQYHANATIDEIAVFDVALSESEVESHYQKGLSGLDYCNQPPVAQNGSYTTAIDVAVPITLTYSDIDGPGPFTFTVVDPPDHGTLSGSGANRTYTPALGYTGNVSFTWQVSDGIVNSNVAIVGILVSTTGENEAPVADPQSVATQRNTPLPIELTYNDPDNGPGPYEVTIVDGPDHGTLSGTGTDRTYTPDTDYAGSDSFTWQVSDGITDSNEALVSIEVQNVPPVAQSTGHQTRAGEAISIPLQYSDPDGLPGPYTFTIVDGPDHGSLSGTGANRTYTPDGDYVGMDSFTWMVNDGADDSNVATATITVLDDTYWLFLPVIDAPD